MLQTLHTFATQEQFSLNFQHSLPLFCLNDFCINVFGFYFQTTIISVKQGISLKLNELGDAFSCFYPLCEGVLMKKKIFRFIMVNKTNIPFSSSACLMQHHSKSFMSSHTFDLELRSTLMTQTLKDWKQRSDVKVGSTRTMHCECTIRCVHVCN